MRGHLHILFANINRYRKNTRRLSKNIAQKSEGVNMIIKNTNHKLGKLIGNINMPVGLTCRSDAPCFKLCYGRRGNYCYKNVRTSIDNNYELYKENPEFFFSVINTELKLNPFPFIRWHSVGDIPDLTYLKGMVSVARKNPKTKFLCFTKQYEIVNSFLAEGGKIPRNLSLVLSNWGNWKVSNPYNLPTAWIRFKQEQTDIPSNAVECSGFCGACANTKSSCWKMKNGDSVVFNQH